MNIVPKITPDNVPDQTIVKNIPAGESRRVEGIADSFYFVRARGPIRVKSNVIPERSFEKGQGKKLPSPALFTYLELHNDNAFDVDVELEYTFGEFIDRRFIVASEEGAAIGVYKVRTEIFANATLAGGTLGNGQEVEFDPDVPPAASGYLKRECVTISNKSVTANLLLLDENDDEIGFVPPNTVLEFDHQSFFKLHNASGAAVDAKAYETWSVDPYL